MAKDRPAKTLQQIAQDLAVNGFGDLAAPLAEGEYVHAANTCPHDGCDWILPREWRDQNGQPTRYRGHAEADALAQAHLETHALANWKGPLHDR